jgi:hypothetical protein
VQHSNTGQVNALIFCATHMRPAAAG